MTQSVAMIGLGKLGLPVAESMAKHYTVYGYDINKDIKSDTVTICDKLYHAVHDVDIVFIAMPTPHDPEYGGEQPISKKIKKDFSYEALDTCLGEIENYVEPGTIVQEIQSGFIFNERLLRPSFVGISKKKGEKSEKNK